MRILKEAGHEVAVYSRANNQNEESAYARYFPPEIETEGLGLSIEALKTAKELVSSSDAKKGLMKVIDGFKPDIAHAHNIYGRLSLSVLDALKEKRIPTVLTLHDYKILCPSYLMLNHGKICERCKGGRFINAVLTRCHKNSLPASAIYAFESWINHRFGKYASTKLLISPSKFLRDKVIEFGWDAGKVEYIPNFIDTSKIIKEEKPGRYLLYLGRLSHEKGVQTLLESLYRTGSNRPPLKIVGDGPEKETLQAKARDMGMDIDFTGYLSGKSLDDAITGARAVVMPSEWYENAPLSLIESFAYGKPVIGARIGGIPDMIDDGMNGILFESGNANDLKEKIEHFVSLSDDAVATMGQSARKKAESVYNPQTHYEKLISAYRRAMGVASSCA